MFKKLLLIACFCFFQANAAQETTEISGITRTRNAVWNGVTGIEYTLNGRGSVFSAEYPGEKDAGEDVIEKLYINDGVGEKCKIWEFFNVPLKTTINDLKKLVCPSDSDVLFFRASTNGPATPLPAIAFSLEFHKVHEGRNLFIVKNTQDQRNKLFEARGNFKYGLYERDSFLTNERICKEEAAREARISNLLNDLTLETTRRRDISLSRIDLSAKRYRGLVRKMTKEYQLSSNTVFFGPNLPTKIPPQPTEHSTETLPKFW